MAQPLRQVVAHLQGLPGLPPVPQPLQPQRHSFSVRVHALPDGAANPALLKLTQTARDTQYYYAYAGYFIYGADVTVRLSDGRQVVGRIECRVKDSECKLYLVALGLERESLPELDTDDQWFWLDWLRQIVPRLGLAIGSSGARL